MNQKLIRFFGILALFLASGAVMTSSAQVPSDSILNANVPFSFIVKDKTFPAGQYTIRQTDNGNDSNYVFEIVNVSGKAKAMVFETEATSASQTPASTNLVFTKIGDKYFLSKMFVKGDNEGNEVVESKMEKNLEKGNAQKEKYVLRIGHLKVVERGEKDAKKVM